jgi:hypothetical protein
MATLRARLTYANVMATIAVFVALGGSSYAAIKVTGRDVVNSSLTGKDVKNSSLFGRDVRNGSLRGADFKAGELPAGQRGPEGPQGSNGTDGADGADGADGKDAASAFVGRNTESTSYPPTQVRFLDISGQADSSDTEAGVIQLSPDVPIVARGLSVKVPVSNLFGGGVVTFTLRDDGADTALTCSVSEVPTDPVRETTKACTSPGTAAISPSSDLSVKVSGSGDAIWRNARFSWRATTP